MAKFHRVISEIEWTQQQAKIANKTKFYSRRLSQNAAEKSNNNWNTTNKTLWFTVSGILMEFVVFVNLAELWMQTLVAIESGNPSIENIFIVSIA